MKPCCHRSLESASGRQQHGREEVPCTHQNRNNAYRFGLISWQLWLDIGIRFRILLQAHTQYPECSWQTPSDRLIERPRYYFLPLSRSGFRKQHLARFVVDIVEQLDLSEITNRYAGSGGKRAYHPALLVALLFYGYATGVFSSRKLEQATYDSVAFRYLTGDQHPDHATIANFRTRFLSELEGLFKQLLELASELGTLRLGTVSLDGSKMQGNASKHKAMSWGYANKLERQIEREVQQLLKLAEAADQAGPQDGEQRQQELDIPEELERREQRLAAIQEAKEKIKERAQERHERERADYEEKMKRRQEREAATGKKMGGRPPKEPEAGPKEKDQVNFTDEESRIMPGAGGEFVQGYNVQAAVDHGSHMVVGQHVSQATNDKQEVGAGAERVGEGGRYPGQAGGAGSGCRIPQQRERGEVCRAGHRSVHRGEPRTP